MWMLDLFARAEAVAEVERQTENAHTNDTIWSYIRSSNVDAVYRLISEDLSVMRERGPAGEIPLHYCFLLGTNSPVHLDMAWKMINLDESLVSEKYTGAKYTGENVLHIAIISRNEALVRTLVGLEQPGLLDSRATGDFFKVGRPCYYGEFPLAFAISTNQFDIFDILVEAGANMNAVDTNGNNILHVLVLHGLEEAYTHFKNRWIQKHGTDNDGRRTYNNHGVMSTGLVPWKCRNNDGYTPFTLCAQKGMKGMFSFLMEERKQVQWSYGPVTCVIYPLDELDDRHWREVNEMHDEALELIVNGSHYSLLTNPRILDLIEKKWHTFGQRQLMWKFCLVMVYLILFTHFTITRQTLFHKTECVGDDVCVPEGPKTILQYLYFYALFILVILGASYKGVKELDEMKQSGLKSYLNAKGSGFLENAVSLTFSILVLGFTAAHLLRSPYERLLLGAASFSGYSYLFFFLLAVKMTGPMVIMVYEMLGKDVLRFSVVYAVFLVGFSQAFYVLQDNYGAQGFYESIHMCFEASLGNFNLNESHVSEPFYRVLTMFLLVGYVLIVTICLLNLLIAMMGDTYGKVNEMAENMWQLERARIIMALENEMPIEERRKPENKYFVEISGERYLQIEDVDLSHFAV